MTLVSFYSISNDEISSMQCAALLTEAFYLEGKRLEIICDNEAQAEEFNDWLWAFKEDSFIPHHIEDEGQAPFPPVTICFQQRNIYKNLIIAINLSSDILKFPTRYANIIEIVPEKETAKAMLRKRYATYKSMGFTLAHTAYP